ncbi:HAMP domain-containing methyl-accepting chemotaxis protein [Xanthobacteraceae bacterium Astr-EGSB]|uniref:methyl-accepting chemotaxis protein n=1 Tax=Astrobacterium formosum TaxID=3069710 RepID=UPI0027B4FAEA|nr:HAMP domain-containing methyl-accepting chemotaxis protein [Xanthobacteraceae bacterium Astr-EGSB]
MSRISISTLLKSVIAIMAVIIVASTIVTAWDAWSRVRSTDRMADTADASVHMFTALANLRLDRTATTRDLNAEQAFATINPQVLNTRKVEMPALKAAIKAIEAIDYPDRKSAASSLRAATETLARLHEESLAALKQPKTARRAGLAKDYAAGVTAAIALLEQLSDRLTELVKLDDPFVDQLLEIKQLAWSARNVGGDVSVMISGPLSGQKIAPDAREKFAAAVGGMDRSWALLRAKMSGLPLPARFSTAVETCQRDLFGADFVALRIKTLNALIAGQPTDYTAGSWSVMSVARLATMESVASMALDVAKSHAENQQAAALRSLWIALAGLAVAVAFAIGMIVMVSRRVVRPLAVINDAMLRLAGGDMQVSVPFGERKDEIGALAGAMLTFRDSMIEADRLRAEQKAAEVRAIAEKQAVAEREAAEKKAAEEKAAAERRAAMLKLAAEFESAVGGIVDTVSSSATELEAAAATLTQTADTTQKLSTTVAAASGQASANVQSVASATEEMSSSVGEIGRQVHESSRIAGHAVQQAQQTDNRINELSQAASRIGDVVKLITAIAEQTNLLALNATIEAARAGEAGKGFAVVAQEVKNLAAQTAKATGEISGQIAGMQTATQDSVGAIKEIGDTIRHISEIAGTIAAAVEEQGSATAEITRNVQQAARGTTEVATNIGEVQQGAAETGSASAQVLASARSLSQDSNRLKTELDRFLSTIRAA